MATTKPEAAKNSGFVTRVVKDPKTPPDVLFLAGFPGASSEEEHTRLYFDVQLSGWVDIPNAAILHRQNMPADLSPLGGELLWIERKAELVHGKAGEPPSKASFLEGRLAQAYPTTVTQPPCPPPSGESGGSTTGANEMHTTLIGCTGWYTCHPQLQAQQTFGPTGTFTCTAQPFVSAPPCPTVQQCWPTWNCPQAQAQVPTAGCIPTAQSCEAQAAAPPTAFPHCGAQAAPHLTLGGTCGLGPVITNHAIPCPPHTRISVCFGPTICTLFPHCAPQAAPAQTAATVCTLHPHCAPQTAPAQTAATVCTLHPHCAPQAAPAQTAATVCTQFPPCGPQTAPAQTFPPMTVANCGFAGPQWTFGGICGIGPVITNSSIPCPPQTIPTIPFVTC